jgi:hypothetical protein
MKSAAPLGICEPFPLITASVNPKLRNCTEEQRENITRSPF